MTDPFRIVPGADTSFVIIHVPHASRTIPPTVRADLLLDDVGLQNELDAMTDAFTDVIADRVAASTDLRPWLFVNQLSRLVVDPERFPDDREEMNAVGMGAVYASTSDGKMLRGADPARDAVLVEQFFMPYSGALAALVRDRRQQCGRVMIIDLHSFPLEPLPYELHGDGPRPEVCLGTDPFHTSRDLQQTAADAFGAFDAGQDSPFSGCYVPLESYGRDRDVQALMVELRRDLYMDESFRLVDAALDPIVSALQMLVDVL